MRTKEKIGAREKWSRRKADEYSWLSKKEENRIAAEHCVTLDKAFITDVERARINEK